MKVGVLGYGRAGKAVVNVLSSDPRFELCWVMRGRAAPATPLQGLEPVQLVGLDGLDLEQWLDQHPVDALVDFSQADAVYRYGPVLRQRGIMLVSAISAYSPEHLEYLRQMGQDTRVMSSPNITLGINFLLLAAKMLREIAPFADVEVVEQHFREKPEISGTARKIAESLQLEDGSITSLRLGGIVGHHEVIFGFPHQTVRLIHDSIRREAFGTGAAFALQELAQCDKGFYSFDDLLMQKIRHQLLAGHSQA
ncbi:MAG: dihydrodipicolinate reductase C-terminal domain-containing protein [Giesbergeria sp.]|uniref:4-hydroxy-tetrahydrodipicolinate reductase n=1 Tax=Giesbergeria sp. TaxID=2818473 RepID=UPI00263980A8|nr:dihydrodipicolinate reductase C-terminal domain-containing protein [Giesbergeria sp.]MDD2608491.1 dihydrodipicolinate reductase C-terminal domain-containing protein [Giesbergeria sp.]